MSETPEPVAKFKHHTQPVTTVEWHPTDSSIFASGGGDNQIALWDLAVERGDDPDDIPVSHYLPPVRLNFPLSFFIFLLS